MYIVSENVRESLRLLRLDTDWNGFIGWRGTNHNNSLIHCGEGQAGRCEILLNDGQHPVNGI